MEIVAVDRCLLQFAGVDEEESEAVVISCVELLLSETNAYYQQRCLAREAVRTVTSRLRDNVLDTVFAAALDAEQALDNHRFEPESRPEAEQKDRHAVRSVPSKSPEKPATMLHTLMLKTSSSPASRVGSSPDKLRPRAAGVPTRRRRKVDKVETEKSTVVYSPPVQTIEREFQDEENPEIKEWREKCLKSLETSSKKSSLSKWVTIARAFAIPDSRVSKEVGVIVAPPPNIVAALAATPIRTKTNVDSFSSIIDPKDEAEEVPTAIEDLNTSSVTARRTSRRPSAVLESAERSLQLLSTTIHSIAETPLRQSKRRSQSASVDLPLQQQRKATLLTDSLSRRKLTRKPSSSESLCGGNSNNGWSSSRSLWRYEQEPGSATSRTFVADGTEFNAATLSATMNVASGVVMMQGESVIEGPEWVENVTTMSRKRFDLQQRLATDALLNAPSDRDVLSPPSSTPSSPLQFGHYPTSSLSEFHFRDYEEVPPEPIPIPQLSPISASALAIPRSHLMPSLSTPSLRVRTSVTSGKAVGLRQHSATGETGGSDETFSANGGSNGGNHNSQDKLKTRPSTALRALADPPRLVPGRARAASAAPGNSRSLPQAVTSMKSGGTASAKYLREFPKPRPGVIRVVNDKAVGLISGGEDRQRTAWMN